MHKLNKKQLKIFHSMMEGLSNNGFVLRDAEDRGFGKTTILNEIGFEYQALGYDVLIVTPFQKQEHIATGYIDITRSDYRTKLRKDRKQLVILDEVDFYHDVAREIIDRCRCLGIPVVGFVKYENLINCKY